MDASTTPAYSPSEFLRTMTPSSTRSLTLRNGEVVPGKTRVGQTLAY